MICASEKGKDYLLEEAAVENDQGEIALKDTAFLLCVNIQQEPLCKLRLGMTALVLCR